MVFLDRFSLLVNELKEVFDIFDLLPRKALFNKTSILYKYSICSKKEESELSSAIARLAFNLLKYFFHSWKDQLLAIATAFVKFEEKLRKHEIEYFHRCEFIENLLKFIPIKEFKLTKFSGSKIYESYW